MLGARDPDEARDIAPLLAGQLASLDVQGPAALRAAGLDASGRDAAGRLGPFWIHLDVDVLDQAAMPATDYLLPGGLGWDELAELLAPLCAAPELAGFSLGCLNPEKDPDGRATAAPATCSPTCSAARRLGHAARGDTLLGRHREQVERRADDGLRVDLVVLVEVGDVARLAEALHAEAAIRPPRKASVCGWPSTSVTIGTSCGNRRSSNRGSPSPRPARAWKERNSRSALVTHTTSTAIPASPASVSAAATASGTSAPMTATTTCGTARRSLGDATSSRYPPATASARVPLCSDWSIGRVDRRKYADSPPGRPSRDSACSRHHSRSWPNAGSYATQPGCSIPIDGVMTDWCAPPSGPSVTPLGVPTRIDWPPA